MRNRMEKYARPKHPRLLALAVALVLLGGLGAPGDAWAAEGGSTSGGALILVGALAGMIALGLPLFVLIGVLAVLSFALFGSDFRGIDTLGILPVEVAKLVGKNELLAIPFFVASGAIMSAGGIARRLVAFARALVGFLPGGLAVATVGACIIFAAISGSSPVTVIAIGSMTYPALLKAGYDRKFALGLVTSAGSLGILIPPSIPMIIYAIVAGGQRPLDVSELFLAGLLPGALIGGLMSIYSMFRAGKGTRDTFKMSRVVETLRDGIWSVSLPIVILGGIYSGVFTPTEAAAISVVYALVIELLIHRDITVGHLGKILGEATVTMGSILIIMSLAVALNIFLVEEEVPQRAVEWIRAKELTPVTFLLLVNVFLLLVGAVMDSISAILIIAPLLAPIAYQLGIDPVHLGIVFIVNLEIGYLTPPIGINLFVASSVFRRSMGEVSRGVLPFIGLMMIGLVGVTYVPSLSLGPVNMRFRDKPFYEPFPELRSEEDEAGGAGDDGDDVNPETGERVQSMEEMMKELGLEEMLDEDMEEEDDDDDEMVGPMGRAPAMPGMMPADDDDDDDDDDEMVGPMGRAPAMVMPSPSAGDTTGE
jgi:C4-dicarboxylate transporter, DctM subunit